MMVTGGCNGRKDININIDWKPIEQVTMFKYLGATITEDATSRKEVEIRICQATGALARLSSILEGEYHFNRQEAETFKNNSYIHSTLWLRKLDIE